MSKSLKEKLKEYSEIIEKYPDIKDFHICRAILYEELKQYKKAIKDYRETIPGYHVCRNIAEVCEENGFIKEAEEFYTKEINKNKSNVNKYINRLHFYLRIKETKKALADCNTILKLSTNNETILTLKKILTGKV